MWLEPLVTVPSRRGLLVGTRGLARDRRAAKEARYRGVPREVAAREGVQEVSLEPNLEAPPFGRGGKVRPAVGRHVLC